MAKKNKRKVEKKQLTPQEKKANAIIAIIIVAVLALAVIATIPTIKENWAANKVENAQQAQAEAETIGDVSKTMGISADEFIEKYGITAEGVGKDTLIMDIVEGMKLEKYVNFINDFQGATTSFQDFVAQYGIPEAGLTAETTVKEAFDSVPTSFYLNQVELDTDFDTLKAEAGLGDDVTLDTPFSQIEEKISPVIQNHIVQATPAPSEKAPAAE